MGGLAADVVPTSGCIPADEPVQHVPLGLRRATWAGKRCCPPRWSGEKACAWDPAMVPAAATRGEPRAHRHLCWPWAVKRCAPRRWSGRGISACGASRCVSGSGFAALSQTLRPGSQAHTAFAGSRKTTAMLRSLARGRWSRLLRQLPQLGYPPPDLCRCPVGVEPPDVTNA